MNAHRPDISSISQFDDALIAYLRRKVARLERENAELRGALKGNLADEWRRL